MKNDLLQLIDSLNLLYYEFDTTTNTFWVDTIWTKKYMYNEFIKITYTLSKYKYKFIVKKNRAIKVTNKNFLTSKFLDLKESFKNYFKKKNSNIFLLNSKYNPWVKNLPLYKIELINQKIDLSKIDALVFTSKNAVFSLNELTQNWKKIPSYAISSNTAKAIELLNGNLEFVGTKKDSSSFVTQISNKFENKRVLYVRAREVSFDLKTFLNNKNVDCEELVVYETKMNEKIKKMNLPQNSIIIFTAPSTIRFFFKVFQWREDLKAVVIGQSTAKYLPKEVNNSYLANKISIDSCISKAIEILD